jgi:hypothetical protein
MLPLDVTVLERLPVGETGDTVTVRLNDGCAAGFRIANSSKIAPFLSRNLPVSKLAPTSTINDPPTTAPRNPVAGMTTFAG